MSFIKERIIFPTFGFLSEQLDLLQQIVHTFKVRQAPLLTSCESYVIIGIKELFVKGITCFFMIISLFGFFRGHHCFFVKIRSEQCQFLQIPLQRQNSHPT